MGNGQKFRGLCESTEQWANSSAQSRAQPAKPLAHGELWKYYSFIPV